MSKAARRRRSRSASQMGSWLAPLLAIAVLGYLWVGPFTPVAIAVGGAAVMLWLLFAAPVTCGASGREGRCRNNATGLLRGCWIRQHRWQKLKTIGIRPTWQKLNRGLWGEPQQNLATVATLLSIVTGLRGALEWAFG